ncbi:hypothetical protein LCGC14_2209740, partial [marine sediment metagenome]
MGKALFERATNLYAREWQRHGDIQHDPVNYVQITQDAPPDARTDRWDRAMGTRTATAQELADYDEVEAN